MLSDWPLLLGWAQQGKAEAHFGEAGVTNLLHLLRDSLRKATGGQLPGGVAPLAGRSGVAGRERQQAQVSAGLPANLGTSKRRCGGTAPAAEGSPRACNTVIALLVFLPRGLAQHAAAQQAPPCNRG